MLPIHFTLIFHWFLSQDNHLQVGLMYLCHFEMCNKEWNNNFVAVKCRFGSARSQGGSAEWGEWLWLVPYVGKFQSEGLLELGKGGIVHLYHRFMCCRRKSAWLSALSSTHKFKSALGDPKPEQSARTRSAALICELTPLLDLFPVILQEIRNPYDEESTKPCSKATQPLAVVNLSHSRAATLEFGKIFQILRRPELTQITNSMQVTLKPKEILGNS